MICVIDGQACDNPPRHRYIWAWGEEGVCCDAHRLTLEGRAVQLGRTISFSILRDEMSDELRALPPDVAELKLQNGALRLELQKKDETITLQAARIQELEGALREADTPAE